VRRVVLVDADDRRAAHRQLGARGASHRTQPNDHHVRALQHDHPACTLPGWQLVANAVRHNIPGGRLDVVTYTASGCATFTIANTGPLVPTGELTRLFQPFQRLSSHAGSSANGAGLGLAIVQAIANAHEATLTARARIGGGLRIDIGFPAAPNSISCSHPTSLDTRTGDARAFALTRRQGRQW
jgi:hypothetical protein